MKSFFDDYLAEQLKIPAVKAAFDEESKVLRVGMVLAKARKKKGLNQKQVAALVGTSAPHLSRTERTPGHANVRTLVRYANAVGMELDFKLVAKR